MGREQIKATSGDFSGTTTDEQRLLHHLLKNYQKAVRPVRNASNAVIVKLGMTMTNIFEMVIKLLSLLVNYCFPNDVVLAYV